MTTKILDSVSFVQKGTGKDMVFLHGYLSSKEAFTAQINYFSRFYRVTAIDFLGFGKSGALTEPFSVTDYAHWTARVLGALNIENPFVIAHSFGCRVAIKMSGEGIYAFDKMLLTGPAGVILRRPLGYYIKIKAYRLCKKWFPQFAERRFGSAEYRTLSPVMRESYKKIVNEDLRKCAKQVENPVFIIEGEEDKTTPMREAQAYAECFPQCHLQTISGGHFAFAENPTLFNLMVEEFFYV